MEYPNKIFISEWKGDNDFGGKSHFCITSVGDSKETVRREIKLEIGIDVEPICLFGAVHPTIWSSDGSKEKEIQFKILYNGNHHIYKKEQL